MDSSAIIDVCEEAVAAIRRALDQLNDWGPAGTRPGQYRSDLVADAAALSVFGAAGWSIMSEESGLHLGSSSLLAVIDPVDGSTNAARGLPWFATSICVLDDDGPLGALVVNQSSGVHYVATRGGGATRDGKRIIPSSQSELRRAFVAVSGYSARHLGWRQYRAMGAAALDLCGVADGTFDAYLDCGDHSHGAWDYLGALLVIKEAGAHIVDRFGEDLEVRDHTERRTPVAAGSTGLLREILAASTDSTRPSSR